MKPLMFTITGPSCAGKTTLLNTLVESYSDVFCTLTSVTTRPPRPGEIEGVEYFFATEEEFKQDMANGHFCQTVHYGGVYYGTPWVQLNDAWARGMVPIRVVEPSGVDQFAKVCKDAEADLFSIFVTEIAEVLVQRWLERVRSAALPDLAYFSKRILMTVDKECEWINEGDYDFYFDPYEEGVEAMIYTLSRIGQGKVPLYRARQLTQAAA